MLMCLYNDKKNLKHTVVFNNVNKTKSNYKISEKKYTNF